MVNVKVSKTIAARYGKVNRESGISSISFSFNVREEISRITPERRCCREALIASILLSGYKLINNSEELLLEIMISIPSTARLVYKLLKEIAGEPVFWEAGKEKILLKRSIYLIFAPNTPIMQEYMRRWGITERLQRKNIRRACCRRAFLMGAFLAAGSINSPYNSYHLEIVQKDQEIAKVLVKILTRMEINGKITRRRNRPVVYVKKADEIANLLSIMGAFKSLLKFEEVRAIKETKQEVRRRVNAETSNLDRTAKAAIRQIHCIRQLKERGILDQLSGKLQQTAILKLRYPQASLRELGEYFSPPITKSSVNCNLRQLENIAHRLKNGNISSKKLKEV